MTAESGRLVLVFDDGYADDYETVMPVLRSAEVPACFAINPNAIGEPGHLTAGQLREMDDAGCEVAAHGRRHRYLQSQKLSVDADAGDERIFVGGPVYPGGDHGVHVGDEYEIVTDGQRVERRGERRQRERFELAGKGAVDDEYLDLAAPLDASYPAGETVVRPTDDVVADEIAGSGADLREMGYDPTTFVLPYDAGDVRAWSTAVDRYPVLANAATRSLPNSPGTPLSNLQRYYLETDALTRVDLADYLDALATRGGLGVLAGHSAWETVPAERVEWTVEAAADRGIEVTTFERIVSQSDGRV